MITNIRKNCVGTISFDAKFPKMRKPQDFIVYPVREGDKNLLIQSDNFWAEINIESGAVNMSARKAQYANSTWLALCVVRKTNRKFSLTEENLKQLVSATKGKDEAKTSFLK